MESALRRWHLGLLSGSCRPVRTSRAVLVRRIGKADVHCLLPGTGNNQARGSEGGIVPDVCEALRRTQGGLEESDER